jgi:hypothetical protein
VSAQPIRARAWTDASSQIRMTTRPQCRRVCASRIRFVAVSRGGRHGHRLLGVDLKRGWTLAIQPIPLNRGRARTPAVRRTPAAPLDWPESAGWPTLPDLLAWRSCTAEVSYPEIYPDATYSYMLGSRVMKCREQIGATFIRGRRSCTCQSCCMLPRKAYVLAT